MQLAFQVETVVIAVTVVMAVVGIIIDRSNRTAADKQGDRS